MLNEKTGSRPLYFSVFQRLIGTRGLTVRSRSRMIDIDGTFYCRSCYDCECEKCSANGDRDLPGILCLVEHEVYNPNRDSNIEMKCGACTKRLAQRAGVPAYKLQLHIFNPLTLMDEEEPPIIVPDLGKISTLTQLADGTPFILTKIIKQRMYPTRSNPVELTPEQLEDWFMEMCDKHEEFCNHPTNTRWDHVLRRDVPKNGMTQAKKASA